MPVNKNNEWIEKRLDLLSSASREVTNAIDTLINIKIMIERIERSQKDGDLTKELLKEILNPMWLYAKDQEVYDEYGPSCLEDRIHLIIDCIDEAGGYYKDEEEKDEP